ncbi:MAG: outer membrane lipoprotein carrier protein LolA [Gemmatimonadales bacterium]|nr:MAG: outer membrane lipoprotein carrier protein LolA [Gemmatimonadales bacterium]
MFRTLALIVPLVLLLPVEGIPGAAPAGAQSPDAATQEALAVLEVAAERYLALDGFCARFEQEVQNDILGQNRQSRGELCQLRSDRFEMRFTDPEGDRVVADGRHLWLYFPSTDAGQVFRSALGEGGERFDLHREFLADPGDRYRPTLDGREEVAGRMTHVLTLVPTAPSPYVRARIWVDEEDALVRRIEITEDEGFTRVLDLRDLELNPGVSPERFVFEPPRGVQIIER